MLQCGWRRLWWLLRWLSGGRGGERQTACKPAAPRAWLQAEERSLSAAVLLQYTVPSGFTLGSLAAAPGYAAIVEYAQGRGGRLLEWKAGGKKYNPAFSFGDPGSTAGPMAWVAGTTFGHTVFVHYDHTTDTATTALRGANNVWTEFKQGFAFNSDAQALLSGLATVDTMDHVFAFLTFSGPWAGGMMLADHAM